MESQYFIVYPSLYEESLEPWIWSTHEPAFGYKYITIINPLTNNKIRCFHRVIEKNFLKKYNQPHRMTITKLPNIDTIVMGQYYRERLGIKVSKEPMILEIKKLKPIHFVLFNWNHPNKYIQSINTLTIVAIILGILSVILGLIAIVDPCKS